MSTDDERPLNQADPYYHWSIYEGKLCISSECCADSFSLEEEAALLQVLLERSKNGEHA